MSDAYDDVVRLVAENPGLEEAEITELAIDQDIDEDRARKERLRSRWRRR